MTLSTPVPSLLGSTGPGRGSAGQSLSPEALLAIAITFVLGVRYPLSPGVPIGFILALLILPVTIGVVRRFRGMGLILALSFVSAGCGLLLTWFAASHGLADHSRAIVQTARVLGLGLGAAAMLWSRTVLGTRLVVLIYAIGFYCSLPLVGIQDHEVWKFSFSVPSTLLLLSLPGIYGKVYREAVILTALAAFSALNDARSAAAMMLIAAALVISQGRRAERRRTRTTLVLARIALVGIGGFFLVQAALLGGDLGSEAQARTEQQIANSGSVLVGGRPEMGAAVALVRHQPLGYGAGAQVSPAGLLLAKAGMEKLGYNTNNNGYVDTYMFGDGIEVHSLLGDLWVLFGIPGMLLTVAALGYVILGMARALGQGLASGVLLFLAVRLVWDFAFSPFPSAMDTLMLVVAIALPTAAAGARPWKRTMRQGQPASTEVGLPLRQTP